MAAYYIQTSRKMEALLRGDEETTWIGELKTLAFWRACAAEFFGTMIFLFVGVAAAVSSDNGKMESARVLQISLAFGLGIMAMVMLTGHISGGHINPAVTIAFAVNLAISPIKALFYVISQLLGGITGVALLYGLSDPTTQKSEMAPTKVNSSITPVQGFGYELVITFLLVSVIMGTTDGKRTSFAGVGLEIGLTVALGHLGGIHYTGASMNPARSFSSAVIGGCWTDHWVYWAGPIIGGCLAALLYKFILSPYRGVATVDDAMKFVGSPEKDDVLEMQRAQAA